MRIIPIIITIAVVAAIAAAILLFKRLTRRSANPVSPSLDVPNIQPGPIRSELSYELIARVEKFETVFAEVYPNTRAQWLDGFKRDANPESENVLWEAIAAAYQSFIQSRSLSIDARQEAFQFLIARSCSNEQQVISSLQPKYLSREELVQLLRLYTTTGKPILYERR